MCLRELAIVDDTLEALGAPKEYQRLRKWIIRIIIGYIIYMFYPFATIYVIFIYEDQNNINFVSICLLYLFNCGKLVHVLSALIWGTILGLVYL